MNIRVLKKRDWNAVQLLIFVDLNCTQKGIGSVLMSALIKSSEEENFWTLQSGVFSENKGSLLLHQNLNLELLDIVKRLQKGMENGKTLFY